MVRFGQWRIDIGANTWHESGVAGAMACGAMAEKDLRCNPDVVMFKDPGGTSCRSNRHPTQCKCYCLAISSDIKNCRSTNSHADLWTRIRTTTTTSQSPPSPLECAVGHKGEQAPDSLAKCLIPASHEQCEEFAKNLTYWLQDVTGVISYDSVDNGIKSVKPGIVETGAWGDEFPKFCSMSKALTSSGTETVHVWWNNNTGDGDAARSGDGDAYPPGSCCHDSARRICCGTSLLPVTPPPTPAPTATTPRHTEPVHNRPPFRPHASSLPVIIQRPANPVLDVCAVWGDPHIQVFDDNIGRVADDVIKETLEEGFGRRRRGSSVTNAYFYGNYWLVQSEAIWIQAHYLSRWTQLLEASSLAKIAVGGPFLHGNTMMIEGIVNGAQVWWNDDIIANGSSLPARVTKMNETVIVTTKLIDRDGSNRTVVWADRRFEIIAKFPEDVELHVNVYPGPTAKRPYHVTTIDVIIKMLQVSGQDGQCGNFNLDPSDDTQAILLRRTKAPVSFNHLIPY